MIRRPATDLEHQVVTREARILSKQVAIYRRRYRHRSIHWLRTIASYALTRGYTA